MIEKIIDGKKIAKFLQEKLNFEIESIKKAHSKVPVLAIILVGNDYASQIYVNNKIKAAKHIGIVTKKIEIDFSVTTNELLSIIDRLNKDKEVSGIIVQLPLPISINKNEILFAISPDKDIDGFHPLNVGYLNSNIDKGFVPCTALGVLELIKKCDSNLSGKNAVIISRSQIVGRPLAALLLKENTTTTICHSSTYNIKNFTKNADIVVSAIGISKFFTSDFFNSNAIVIDVGISRLDNGKISGDIDFEKVIDGIKYISPVPGGVGPMTVTFLLKNCLKAFKIQNNICIT